MIFCNHERVEKLSECTIYTYIACKSVKRFEHENWWGSHHVKMRFCGRSLPSLWWYNPLVYIIRAWFEMYTNKMRERDWNLRFCGTFIAHWTTFMNKESPDYSQTGGERWSVWHSHHCNSKGWRETRTKLSSFVCLLSLHHCLCSSFHYIFLGWIIWSSLT